MSDFSKEVLAAAAREREVELTTSGRRTGNPHRKVIWVSGDGRRLFIRSGGGLMRDWPRNFMASGRAILHVGGIDVPVGCRHVTEPAEARAVSRLVAAKYGPGVQASAEGEPLTAGEQASFELLPA